MEKAVYSGGTHLILVVRSGMQKAWRTREEGASELLAHMAKQGRPQQKMLGVRLKWEEVEEEGKVAAHHH